MSSLASFHYFQFEEEAKKSSFDVESHFLVSFKIHETVPISQSVRPDGKIIHLYLAIPKDENWPNGIKICHSRCKILPNSK